MKASRLFLRETVSREHEILSLQRRLTSVHELKRKLEKQAEELAILVERAEWLLSCARAR